MIEISSAAKKTSSLNKCIIAKKINAANYKQVSAVAN